MKAVYSELEMHVLRFESQDVIATSGTEGPPDEDW